MINWSPTVVITVPNPKFMSYDWAVEHSANSLIRMFTLILFASNIFKSELNARQIKILFDFAYLA